MKKSIGIAAFCSLVFLAFSLPVSNPEVVVDRVAWLSWEDAMVKMRTEKRKIFVKVYEPSCKWCSHMETTTFQNSQIASYLNENFYPVKYDVTNRESIKLKDQTFKYVKGENGHYNEFASFLTMGGLKTPTSVFLDEKLEILQPLPGYKDPATFEIIMTYYGEDHYRYTPWSMYKESYVPMTQEAKKD